MSFARSVRTIQADDAASFGSYDNIASSPEEEEPLEDAMVNAAIGYEQGISQPYTADRQRAMRVLTRKGQILDGNPYRLPGVSDGAEQGMPRSKDDFEVVYHSDALAPIREEAAAPPKLTVEAIQPRRPLQEARATAYLDEDTLARLEGDELFSDNEWEHINDSENVPVSKFSPYDSDSPPHRTGVFRSLSKKVKGSFRRPARPEISAPLLDLRHEPDNPAGMPTVMSYAVPIRNPAPELAARAGNVQEAINLRRQNANIAGGKSSKNKKRRDFEAPRPAPPRPQKQHKVKVVGDPDRMTQLGDFIDVCTLDSSSEELVEDDESYDRERKILKVQSLHPLRKPSKKVDTSKYSWMPPEPSALPKPLKVTSQNDWHMSADYPGVDDLFNKIDQQIEDMGVSGRGQLANGEYRLQNQESAGQPAQETTGADYEDEEPEIIVDTYIQGDHTLWRATERVGENTTRSTQQRFRRERTDRSSEEDEAAALMARLQAVRK